MNGFWKSEIIDKRWDPPNDELKFPKEIKTESKKNLQPY